MPAFSALLEQSVWGPMRSTWPPITVPAWASMFSGRDPGELGVYGFRNRIAHSYELAVVQSTDVTAPMLWDVLADHERTSAVLFAPPSYPVPSKPARGHRVSCFLTPPTARGVTHPPSLADELEDRVGPLIMDVDGYRATPSLELFERICAMTRQHFEVTRYISLTKKPDLCVMVDIGPDRFHHAFWRFIDPAHPLHDPEHPFAALGPRYYRLLDDEIHKTLQVFGSNLNLLIVSDHGAQPALGGACLNEWLIETGWLTLLRYPSHPTALTSDIVDWASTRAWAEGGYYGRVFLNVRDREPCGVVRPEQIDATRAELRDTLRHFPAPSPTHADASQCGGTGHLALDVHTPRELYREPRGLPPDLLVSVENFRWRALGTVGHGTLHVQPTMPDRAEGANGALGLDGCNHAMHGVFVLRAPDIAPRAVRDEIQITDVFATALGVIGIAPPIGTRGRDWSRPGSECET